MINIKNLKDFIKEAESKGATEDTEVYVDCYETLNIVIENGPDIFLDEDGGIEEC